jgi:hypothetical protein
VSATFAIETRYLVASETPTKSRGQDLGSH